MKLLYGLAGGGPALAAVHPLLGGIIAGVLHTVLGPDHISTIVTLSACQGADAFWFGVRWAAGHLTGMTVIGLLFTLFNTWHGGVGLETYEHYADYVIGFMLVSFGGYFLLNADKYFDAQWKPKAAGCACHGCPGQADLPAGAEEDPASERRPLQPRRESDKLGHDHGAVLRRSGSVLVGFFQGVACPAGLVGLIFLKQYSGSIVAMALFVATFFAATTLAMGLMAMAYGVLTERCVASAALGRAIYCASAALSLTLGLLWIVLNASGQLDAVMGHSHGEHGGMHDHHHHDAAGSVHAGEGGTAAHWLLMLAAPR